MRGLTDDERAVCTWMDTAKNELFNANLLTPELGAMFAAARDAFVRLSAPVGVLVARETLASWYAATEGFSEHDAPDVIAARKSMAGVGSSPFALLWPTPAPVAESVREATDLLHEVDALLDRVADQAPTLHDRKLQEAVKAYAAGFHAAPVADTLRTLLQERNHRTDGDLQALADRCLHLSRGDRDLIAMRGRLIEELEAAARREYTVPPEIANSLSLRTQQFTLNPGSSPFTLLWPAARPSGEVTVLARGWFHPLPAENPHDVDDYEFHDIGNLPEQPCPNCVPAMIVRRPAASEGGACDEPDEECPNEK